MAQAVYDLGERLLNFCVEIVNRWLMLVLRVPLIKPPNQVAKLIAECDELIRIFVASIRTAEKHATVLCLTSKHD